MFAKSWGPGPPRLAAAARHAAARLDGMTIYLGPCRRQELVLQVQFDALDDDGGDDDLDLLEPLN
jgi:hypothetical protein